MILKSSQLGEIEIEENRVVSFPGGIPLKGSGIRHIPIDKEGPFYYMHALKTRTFVWSWPCRLCFFLIMNWNYHRRAWKSWE